jgi:hypothetical protein
VRGSAIVLKGKNGVTHLAGKKKKKKRKGVIRLLGESNKGL